jgi:hypothetical protein
MEDALAPLLTSYLAYYVAAVELAGVLAQHRGATSPMSTEDMATACDSANALLSEPSSGSDTETDDGAADTDDDDDDGGAAEKPWRSVSLPRCNCAQCSAVRVSHCNFAAHECDPASAIFRDAILAACQKARIRP